VRIVVRLALAALALFGLMVNVLGFGYLIANIVHVIAGIGA
jgi:hypothetical protein